jgi:hypothetical protein
VGLEPDDAGMRRFIGADDGTGHGKTLPDDQLNARTEAILKAIDDEFGGNPPPPPRPAAAAAGAPIAFDQLAPMLRVIPACHVRCSRGLPRG